MFNYLSRKNTLISMFLLIILSFSNSAFSQDKHRKHTFAAIIGSPIQEIGILILEEVYKDTDVKFEVVRVPAKRAESMLGKGIVDGEVLRVFDYGLNKNDVIRVPTSYYTLETTPLSLLSSKITINGIDDLSKLSVVRMSGHINTEVAIKNIKVGFVSNVNSSDLLVEFLSKGRADVALMSLIDAKITAKQMNLSDQIVYHDPIKKFPLHIYVHSSNKDMVSIIDAKIRDLISTGRMGEIILDAEKKVISNWR